MPGQHKKPKLRRQRWISFTLYRRRSPARKLWARQRGIAGPISDFFAGLILITVGLFFGIASTWMLGIAISPLIEASNDFFYVRDHLYWLEVIWMSLVTLLFIAVFFLCTLGIPLRMLRSFQDSSFHEWALRHIGKGYRGRSDLCFECGYDLSHGRSLSCPECGARAASHLAELR